MNRKHANGDMDSGLGSDEDRRSRTKEQKQLHNQQLLSGCFIDAATLSDEPESTDQRRNDERRQGTLIFQSSMPQFSMLQISERDAPQRSTSSFPETGTPYNSIVQLEKTEEPEENKSKMSLGFYVDLSEVPDDPTPPSTSSSSKKNIFSMVIDFEAPKKDKPNKLSSSFIARKRTKGKCNNGNSNLSSSVSSINSSTCVAGTSRQPEEHSNSAKDLVSIEVVSASLVKNLSVSSKSSSISESEKVVVEKSEEEPLRERTLCTDLENNNNDTFIVSKISTEGCEDEGQKSDANDDISEEIHNGTEISDLEEKQREDNESGPQFVKLSDLECQKPKADLNFTPRMSKSIPESHWVESPFLMSRSACYRSAPHPIQPEPCEIAPELDDSAISNSSTSQPKKAVRRLGTDLLRMFLEEIETDVIVEVERRKLKAHKCILASRCQYFAALLSGNQLEKSGNVISMQGFSYEAVYFSLCHIYSGAAHVPDSISLVELATLADMLGLEGLKEIVECALRQRHCHNFHKPCAGCCTGVLEVLPLSATYGLDDLYQKCLQWITQHFVSVWPSRAFASLPWEVREKCYQQHVVHMTPDKVLETMVNSEKVLITLPSVRWAEPVARLVSQLTDACDLYHRQHYAAVLASPSFCALNSGFGCVARQIEEQMLTAAKNLGVDQACRSYSRICKMVEQHWGRPFADLLNKIKLKLEQCLVNQADALIRSNAWLRLDTALRTRIKELSPALEPQSRLPRATSLRNKKPPGRNPTHSPLISSTDSSRHPSPAVNNQQVKLQHSISGTSLRRVLLLAAKSPQAPPATQRRSTLTQPTAASALKSTPARNVRTAPSSASAQRNSSRSTTTSQVRPSSSHGSMTSSTISQKSVASKRSSSSLSRNSSLGKQDVPTKLSSRRPESRANSPFKSETTVSSPKKVESRLTAKSAVRSISPLKNQRKPASPRRLKTNEGQSKATPVPPPPPLQRSGTFLKDEPTVLGKVM